MGHEKSRRLQIVMEYLYPQLANNVDYKLQNDCDGRGTYVIWLRKDMSPPTDEALTMAKRDAVEAYFWKRLRQHRDVLLCESDLRALPDCPQRNAWLSYRQALRDLPATIVPPVYEDLIAREDIDPSDSAFPAKP